MQKKRNRIYKKIIISGLVVFSILSSCSDEFLEKKPQGVVFEEYLANKEGLEKLLISAYAAMDGLIPELEEEFYWPYPATSGSNWMYGDLYADDAHKGGLGTKDFAPGDELARYESSTGNMAIKFKWKATYEGIARCNEVLKILEIALNQNNVSEEEGINFKAEARFLRGYYHLEAIKMWDFVPYVDENAGDYNYLIENYPTDPIESNAGNKPWSELGGNGYIPWLEVEEDFQYAIENLPESPRNNHDGRATKYSAVGLLGKIKLFKQEYNEALSLFNEIISSGQYALLDNYHDNFTSTGDNKREAIFQIQFAVNDISNTANGNIGDAGNGAQGTFVLNKPTQNFVNAFKTTNGVVNGIMVGLPYLSVFNLDFNAPGDDVKSDDGLEATDPFTPDTRPLDPRLDWSVGRRGIPYLDHGNHPGNIFSWVRDQKNYGPYNSIKHVEHNEHFGTYTYQGWAAATANNYSVMRYADVLLMAAECEVERGGDLNRARELINMVRARARNGGWVMEGGIWDDGSHSGPNGENPAANYLISEYPTGSSSDPFQTMEGARQAVRFERRIELGSEGHRFWDLKRWGIAKETLNKFIESESVNRIYLQGAYFEDKNIRHPIPQTEIDNSQETLHQNPDY